MLSEPSIMQNDRPPAHGFPLFRILAALGLLSTYPHFPLLSERAPLRRHISPPFLIPQAAARNRAHVVSPPIGHYIQPPLVEVLVFMIRSKMLYFSGFFHANLLIHLRLKLFLFCQWTVKEMMTLWATTPIRSPQQKGIVTGMVCDKVSA